MGGIRVPNVFQKSRAHSKLSCDVPNFGEVQTEVSAKARDSSSPIVWLLEKRASVWMYRIMAVVVR